MKYLIFAINESRTAGKISNRILHIVNLLYNSLIIPQELFRPNSLAVGVTSLSSFPLQQSKVKTNFASPQARSGEEKEKL